MRSLLVWQESFPDVDGERQVVWDLAFRADGALLVAAVGKRLIVFNAADGTVVKKRQGAFAFPHRAGLAPPCFGARARRP